MSASSLTVTSTQDQTSKYTENNVRPDESTSDRAREGHDDKGPESAFGEEEEELAQMSNYSVKSLTSLASYPNPHQKMAQRALDRARETFKAAAEASRPVSPSLSSRKGCDIASILPPASELGREGNDYLSRIPRSAHIASSARSSMLASGPGAPQPLTAGPPGQRQYKASTLEGPLRAIQASGQKPGSSNVETQPNFKHAALPNLADLPHAPAKSKMLYAFGASQARQPCAQALDGTRSSHPWDRTYPPSLWFKDPQETRSVDQIKQYYPNGVPPYYNSKSIVSVPDDNSDLPLILHSHDRTLLETTGKARHQDDVCHQVAFYSAIHDLTKTWDERLDDMRIKEQNFEAGLNEPAISTTARQEENIANLYSSSVGKPEDIDMSFFNEMETFQAVQPLLGMTFTSLAKYWQNGRLLGHPTGFSPVNKPESEELWAQTRSIEYHKDYDQFQSMGTQSKWGLPHTPPPASRWSGCSGGM